MVKQVIIFFLLCGCCFGNIHATNSGPNSRRGRYLLTAVETNTVSFTWWMYPEAMPAASGYNRVFIKGGGASYQFTFGTAVNNESWAFGWYDINWAGMSVELADIPSNEWSFISCVFNHPENYVAVYVNAVELTNEPTVGGLRDTYAYFELGTAAPTIYSLVGYFHDLRFYHRALSPNEIYWLYKHPWELANDSDLYMRTDMSLEDTGTTLTGTMPNYGTGVSGNYYSNPVVAPTKFRIKKPLGMNLP